MNAVEKAVEKFFDRFFPGPLIPRGCPRVKPVTAVLIIGIVIVSLCSQFGKNAGWRHCLTITNLQFIGGMPVWDSGLSEIRHGEVWRLFSPFFLHFSFLHTLANSFGLWVFGTQFEWKHGPVRFLAFFVAANLAVNLTIYSLVGPRFGGASAVVMALLGYLLWRAKVQKSPGFTMPTWVPVVVFVEMAIAGTVSEMSSLAGHIAGLLFGFFVAWLVTPARRVQPIA